MLSFKLNGQPVTADDLPGKTLDRCLRDDLRMTGTKVGCSPGDGDCGCCTVLIDGAPERACLVAASDVAGKRVETIEGLASNGDLHPVQEAFVRTGAVQCGFCVPGFVMAAKALLERNSRPGREEIYKGLSGILCRCTGYNKVIEAVEQAATFLSEGEWPPIESQVGEAADGGPLGVSVIRKDSIPKVTGKARFAADWYLEDMLHCKLLFSEHPHAELLSIDTSAAEEIPGVALVLTSRNSPEVRRFGQKIQDVPVFAEDRVHCVGTVVAAVYAETEEQAREGVAAIRVSYRALPAVFDPEEALREDAPRVHPDYPDGNRLTHAVIRRGDVDRAFEEADLVVEGDYSVPWVDHAFLEPESAVAYRDEEGRVTVVIASQNTYRERGELAGALGLPLEKVRVVSPAIGGAFGGKSGLSIHPYVALGLLRTDRPVKLVTNREESFLVHVKKHAMRLHYKTGVTRDGKILAVERRAISDGGAYAHGGPMILAQSTVFGAGPYDVPNLRLEGIRTYTNNLPCGAFRGYGINQSAFAMESQLDEIARALDIDPIELRERNALAVGMKTSTGQVLEASVGFKECLGKIREGLATRRTARPEPGRKIGVGIAGAFKNCGIGQGRPDLSGAVMELTGTGDIRLRLGATDLGEGIMTVASQMAAHTLGVPYEEITLMDPDTALTPDGGQTSASRQTLWTGNAVVGASQALKEKLFNFVAEEFEIAREDLVWDGKGFASKGGRPIADNRTVADRARGRGVELSGADEFEGPKTVSIIFDDVPPETEGYRNYLTFSFVANAAVVEVDETTGEVKVLEVIVAADCGKVIHPRGLEGQVEGCVSMGLGYALSEEYKVENGRPLTRTLTDAGIPTIEMTPEVRTFVVEDPEPYGPFGAKGFAEAGLLPTAPAITNAIYDAVGVRITDLPATPKKVLEALRAKGS